MENLVRNLDEILNKLTVIRDSYQVIKAKNIELENQISILKVEADEKKSVYISLKKELEDREEEIKIIKSSVAVLPPKVKDVSKDPEKTETQNGIKMQLDELIEDIDQCIQIIQSKE